MFSSFVQAQQLLSLHRGAFRANQGFLSPEIWHQALGNSLPADGNMGGIYAGDDFVNFHALAPAISGTTTLPSTTVPAPLGYGIYLDTATSACAITSKSGAMNTCRMSVGATDNHEAWMTSGGNIGALGRFSCTAGQERFAAFEVIFSVPQIGANNGCIFLGMAEPGLAAANTKVDDTGVMVDKDFIGFNTVQATPDQLDIIFKEEGSTQQTVLANALTMAVDTLYNAGFVYNPKWPPSKRFRFYINNTELDYYISDAQMAASTFPNAVMMAFLAGLKTGSATAAHLDIKRWRFFQQETA